MYNYMYIIIMCSLASQPKGIRDLMTSHIVGGGTSTASDGYSQTKFGQVEAEPYQGWHCIAINTYIVKLFTSLVSNL